VERRRDRLLAETAAIRSVLRNRALGRLVAGWFATNAATYAFLVVTLVVAYDAGGAFAAGLLGVVRYVPPALIAPLAGMPATRWRADRVLLAVNLARTISVTLTGMVLAIDGPLPLLFLLVGLEAGFGGMTRPLHMSLLPWLAQTPGELVASNIASSAAEGLGTLAGPAIAGLLLATSGSIGATAATAALMGIAVFAVASVHVPMIRTSPPAAGLVDRLTAGVRAATRTTAIWLVLVDVWLQTFVRGMLTVLLVVAAIDRLGLGQPGVGTLNAAIGAGGFVGALVALSLTRRAQFSPTFAMALALWGLPIAVIGIVSDPLIAIGMLAIVGLSNAILDVTGFTLLQRSAPNDARVGVMGLVDSGAAAFAAAGGLVASVLVTNLGVQGSLLVAGAILPVTAALTLAALRRSEARTPSHEVQTHLLRSNPLLSPLSLSIVEELAAVMRPIEFEAGSELIREGESGDRYLIVSAGEVEVSQNGRVLRRLGPGAGLGEISLLRDVPRTATVRATTQVVAYALDREAFLSAVTGHHVARSVADHVVDDHLARSKVGTTSHPPPE
jgi:MFS family permease